MAFQEFYTFQMPTKIVHGIGSLRLLPDEIRKLGVQRPWIVTDPGIANAGILRRVTDLLEGGKIPYGVFTGTPLTATVNAAIQSYAEAREFDFDSVIALGGGSSLVVGKVTAILGANGASPRDYEANGYPHPPLACIAIPTTAGSGAEVSKQCPMVDEERHYKFTLTDPKGYPTVALLDANLLRTLPKMQAVFSGADALTHAIEAYSTTFTTPITDCLAEKAMGMLYHNLRPAILTGDLAAWDTCLVASTMANMACGNAKLGLVHGLARNVQALFDVTYGLTIAVFLPPVMAWNTCAAPERFATMARLFGTTQPGATLDEQAAGAVQGVKQLLADLDCPRMFSPQQVNRDAIPTMARLAFARGTVLTGAPDLDKISIDGYVNSPNIRRARYDDVVRLYEQTLEGWTL